VVKVALSRRQWCALTLVVCHVHEACGLPGKDQRSACPCGAFPWRTLRKGAHPQSQSQDPLKSLHDAAIVCECVCVCVSLTCTRDHTGSFLFEPLCVCLCLCGCVVTLSHTLNTGSSLCAPFSLCLTHSRVHTPRLVCLAVALMLYCSCPIALLRVSLTHGCTHPGWFVLLFASSLSQRGRSGTNALLLLSYCFIASPLLQAHQHKVAVAPALPAHQRPHVPVRLAIAHIPPNYYKLKPKRHLLLSPRLAHPQHPPSVCVCVCVCVWVWVCVCVCVCVCVGA
jgi:hypothetical protein